MVIRYFQWRYRWTSDFGPCYDLCGCRICWWGWTGLSWRSRFRLRYFYCFPGEFWLHRMISSFYLRYNQTEKKWDKLWIP